MFEKIQSIVFPNSASLEDNYQLFYRGCHSRVKDGAKSLAIPDSSFVDFTTYMNSCSFAKWKKYTNIQRLRLNLTMSGEFDINLVGYHLVAHSIFKKSFLSKHYSSMSPTEIKLDFPENDEMIVGFEIVATKDVVLHSGFYSGEYDESDINDVTLCIGTTTCRKEEFITHNMNLIREEILEADDDMKNHFYVHVIDNGSTLDAEALSSWHMTVHPNKNVGGAGGFARGMIEALENEVKATHVLLMDDDVVVLPESIRRTYVLLRLLKEEYKDSLVSGAMLRYEEMYMQHEDIGTIYRPSNIGFQPLKPPLDQRDLIANLINEGQHYGSKQQYAAWWYCCIPIQMVEKNGLPLPIFIRCDDVEYGLRCKTHIITMNGIGIWHMAFTNKYNLAIDRYQTVRNLMIDKAVGSIADYMDIDRYAMLCFRMELLRFNYNAAEIVLRAVKDYIKGPEFIEQDLGEKILKENVKSNEEFKPIGEFGLNEVFPHQAYEHKYRGKLSKIWYGITYNGQRFWPTGLLKKEWEFVLFNDVYQPGNYTRRKKLLVVNPELKLATVREIDKVRYRKLKADWNRTWKYYKKHRDEIAQSYKDAFPYMTSMEFWKKYLEMN